MDRLRYWQSNHYQCLWVTLTSSPNSSAKRLRADFQALRKRIGRELEFPGLEYVCVAWAAALERAGISEFRWHDLRHTWASWHVQAGTPLHVLQELGGWECVEMVRKYAHLSSERLAGYVDRLSGLKSVAAGEMATIQLRAS